jgi:hypothetical protein
MESMIDSLIAVDGSMEEYWDKVVTRGFSHQEEVGLNETLTPFVGGFSQEDGVAIDALRYAPQVWIPVSMILYSCWAILSLM